ncbi:PACE efflux transporter [Glaciimonas sp. CA11.2]|uniref:PACE efflux transporter n=1 Tax=unclassified Glaciimonas TaxID=2644401 RepID=UPI002AB56C00|nr:MULTISPECIES: PACE efflux transporter [unclassified Glaciimonas]MDY7546005.1 PACE efflux transporter [Glaciimonas sp. CA11.2]MEB0012151.1 PACE efflux transporter [Glaciimonas sp. Cout2]MEB0082334.1 PACE efflux transporter [Glaciimonas sp. Gout2]MEB0163310.1 PACE efflux transporter [Glaciimonas sp. CA11.2]
MTISTLFRRILHAILFEIGALVILVPLMSYGLGLELFHFGALALILALCAMACNMLYNHGFEWFETRYGWVRTIAVRVGHTLGFELCFMAVALPITAWWMSISVVQAFMLDLVFSVFFMVYAFCFNWLYDIARRRLKMRTE